MSNTSIRKPPQEPVSGRRTTYPGPTPKLDAERKAFEQAILDYLADKHADVVTAELLSGFGDDKAKLRLIMSRYDALWALARMYRANTGLDCMPGVAAVPLRGGGAGVAVA